MSRRDWDDETAVSPEAPEGANREEARGRARDRAYLIVLTGSSVGEMYKIAKTEVVLGRGQQADVQVLDDGVSRRHAQIKLAGDKMIVEDLGSRNGTFVNGERINVVHILADGDKIQVGGTTILKFTYHDHLDESFQRRMYESALRDGLTRAFNKKYFLDRIESEFRFAKRHAVPLSLLLFDIDHFKRINDDHGHLAGDHVLTCVAKKVAESIRNEDVFARYGGEEFAVLCRAIELDNAILFAERLRKGIHTMDCRYQGKVLPVTVSFGVASLPQVEAEDPVGLIGAADKALYAAKRKGRNRVCTAGEAD
jgi:two-component system, cell cycle response regulator